MVLARSWLALMAVLLLVGCQQQAQGSFYKSSGESSYEEAANGNGNHKATSVFVESDVLADLDDDGKATVVIEINNKNIKGKTEKELKRIIDESRSELLKALASKQVHVISTFEESNVFTAEITSDALDTLKNSRYVKSVKSVKVIRPREMR